MFRIFTISNMKFGILHFYIFALINFILPININSSDIKELLQLDTVEEHINYYNYPFEQYNVVTDDGYNLSLHRIPYSTNSLKQGGTPVLLLHGLFGSSMSFILGGPKKALGFILSDAGYDVWIMNFRGNKYSNKHVTLKANDPQFWNSSYHELGIYDLPAVLDFVLENTNQKNISIVAYSQGTTASFVMLAEKPDYNAKVKSLISYSPSVYKCRIKMIPLRIVAQAEKSGFWTTLRNNYGDFDLNSLITPFSAYVRFFCQNLRSLCVIWFGYFSNLMPHQIDWETFDLQLKHYPDGSAFKQIVHFFQAILDCKFRKYQSSPKDAPNYYNLKNVLVDNFVFYADRDTLQDPEDVLLLEENLSKSFRTLTKISNFGHGDFMHGLHSSSLVFKPTVDILNSLQ